MKLLCTAGVCLLSLAAFCESAHANFSVSDGNTTVGFVGGDSDGTGSVNSMSDWFVDGVDQLFDQSFYIRVGETAETRVGTGNMLQTGLAIGPGLLGGVSVALTYEGTAGSSLEGIKIQLVYSILGGTAGSHTSDIGEQIAITNTGESRISDINFFQYVDLDLNGDSTDDQATYLNANTVEQIDTGGGVAVNETVFTPNPDRFEAALWPVTLTKLNDGSPTDLSNQGFASGDVTWANQWIFNLAAGGRKLISKDKQISPIPEPASMALLGLGSLLAGFGVVRRKRKSAEELVA